MVVLTSFTQPTNGIRHRQQNTVVYVNNNNLGKGTLYIAESRLSWIGESGNGFSIEYPHIALHAISRDLSAFPQECLFLMLDTPLADDDDQNNGEDEAAEGDDDSNKQETTEMRLVPDDRGMLDAMFHAMNECQALHPDPEDSFSDEDFFEDADDESPMEDADSQMARLRIGNMDGRGHMQEDLEDMEEDMVEGRAEGRVGGMREYVPSGILGSMGEDKVGGRVGGRAVDRAVDRTIDWSVSTVMGRMGDLRESMALGISGQRVREMEDSTWDILGGDREEGREEGTLEGREEGMAEGMVEGTVEGTVESTSDILGGDMEEGKGAGAEGGREGGRVTQGIFRHDRS